MDAKLRDLVTEHLADGCRHDYGPYYLSACIKCLFVGTSCHTLHGMRPAVGIGNEYYNLENLMRLRIKKGIDIWIATENEEYEVRSFSLEDGYPCIREVDCIEDLPTALAIVMLEAIGINVEE